ncbi:hypothetical protein, partial [Mesorhizobium sp. M1E.F.Ca.ET.041.01.1.1]|uniref:hypothetical protein n=1 Tax=Mesorhizobium sp. M1E.F.Ca.ET.041.01.1.1 TaxID=2496759 RepID=UPI001AED0A84
STGERQSCRRIQSPFRRFLLKNQHFCHRHRIDSGGPDADRQAAAAGGQRLSCGCSRPKLPRMGAGFRRHPS